MATEKAREAKTAAEEPGASADVAPARPALQAKDVESTSGEMAGDRAGSDASRSPEQGMLDFNLSAGAVIDMAKSSVGAQSPLAESSTFETPSLDAAPRSLLDSTGAPGGSKERPGVDAKADVDGKGGAAGGERGPRESAPRAGGRGRGEPGERRARDSRGGRDARAGRGGGEDARQGEGRPTEGRREGEGERRPPAEAPVAERRDEARSAEGGRPGPQRPDRQERSDRQDRGDRRQERGARGGAGGAKTLILQDLVARANGADPLLKMQLTGVIGIALTNSGEKYLFDWMGEAPHARLGTHDNPDCVIHLAEGSLMRIASGELNPQIAMLSDKIRVEGKLSFAVYFFNLIVPKGSAAQ